MASSIFLYLKLQNGFRYVSASCAKKFLTFLLFFALSAGARAAGYERIISFYSGHTDNIIALGGASRLVAFSKNDAPERLTGLPRLPLKANAESILALSPDLVLSRSFAAAQNPGLYEILGRAGVKVIFLDPPLWEDFPDYLCKIAELIGADPEEAAMRFKNLCTALHDEAEARRGEKARARVFVEATAKEIHTCAPQSWAANLIRLVGGVNAAASAVPTRAGSSVAPWGVERAATLAASRLDVYLVQQGAMNGATLEQVFSRPWSYALQGVKVARIPEYELSRPSLLGLEAGGKKLIEIFYGE